MPATASPGQVRTLLPTRPEDEIRFERSVVDFIVQATEVLGVPKSVAAIYGVIFASARPLCFADVEERLELSKGSISQGLRLLGDVGAVKTVAVPGDRREYFTPDMELRKLILRFMENRLETQLDTGERALESLLRAVPTTDAAAAAQLSQRLKYLRTWHVKARALLPVAKTFLKLGG